MKVHLVLKNWRDQSVCGKHSPPLGSDNEKDVTCKVCLLYIEGRKRRELKKKPTTPLSERNQPMV